MFARSFLIVTAIICFPSSTLAQENVDAKSKSVIDRIVEAYGGDRLRNLKSITIKADRRLGWPGQGQTAQYVDFVQDRFIRHFDLQNRYGSVERWNLQNGNVYHNRYIFDADGAQTIDYMEGVYNTEAGQTYIDYFASDYRMSDLMLANFLVSDSANVTYSGTSDYNGYTHDILTFQITENAPEVRLFVSQGSGLITRLQLDYGDEVATIVYSGHERIKGVTYASENRTFLGETLVEYSQSLQVEPNKNVKRAIKRDSYLTTDREQFDLTVMTIDEVAPKVFHVGLDDYSFFVEHDGGYILINPYAGLEARHKALNDYRGLALPITQVVSTHHHDERLADISYAMDQGAQLLITSETEKVMQRYGTLPAEGRYSVLTDEAVLGPLTIYIRPTQQAVENAFIYHRDGKILYQDDHYNGLYKDGPTWVRPTGAQLYEYISELNIEVDYILASHARKAEPWTVFREGVQNTLVGGLCPSEREICAKTQLQR